MTQKVRQKIDKITMLTVMQHQDILYVPWLMRRNHWVWTGVQARSFEAIIRRSLITTKSDTMFVMPEEKVERQVECEENERKQVSSERGMSEYKEEVINIYFNNSHSSFFPSNFYQMLRLLIAQILYLLQHHFSFWLYLSLFPSFALFTFWNPFSSLFLLLLLLLDFSVLILLLIFTLF